MGVDCIAGTISALHSCFPCNAVKVILEKNFVFVSISLAGLDFLLHIFMRVSIPSHLFITTHDLFSIDWLVVASCFTTTWGINLPCLTNCSQVDHVYFNGDLSAFWWCCRHPFRSVVNTTTDPLTC